MVTPALFTRSQSSNSHISTRVHRDAVKYRYSACESSWSNHWPHDSLWWPFRAAFLYDSRITAANHHYLKVKAELHSLLFRSKPILICAFLKKNKPQTKTSTNHQTTKKKQPKNPHFPPPCPTPLLIVGFKVETEYQFPCKTEDQLHSNWELRL